MDPDPEPAGSHTLAKQTPGNRNIPTTSGDRLQEPTYRLRLIVPKTLQLEGRKITREDFYGWIWREFTDDGMLGVDEGTLLSDEAIEQGIETDAWTVDAAQAPRERDWIAQQESESVAIYFASETGAKHARQELLNLFEEGSLPGLKILGIETQEPADWDAQWKASFKGAKIPPFWHVIPHWEHPEEGRVPIIVNPGAGFGTGTHETTQLCLQALGELGQDSLEDKQVLDFGSGSGILAIGAALLGSPFVFGVEIDPLAIENAEENAALNQVSSKIEFSEKMPAPHSPEKRLPIPERFDVVMANILRPVLLEHAEMLVSHLEEKGGVLILSGLIADDVGPVSEVYSKLLGGLKPEVRELNEWRALVWKR